MGKEKKERKKGKKQRKERKEERKEGMGTYVSGHPICGGTLHNFTAKNVQVKLRNMLIALNRINIGFLCLHFVSS